MAKDQFGKYIILIVGPLFLVILYMAGKINNDKFYRVRINSKIVSRSIWRVKATGFYVENGLRIDSTAKNEIDIKIGDSIVKEPNSWYFKVFRENIKGDYVYYKIYSME